MDRTPGARPDEPEAGALDAAALARLSELDPSGCNGLVARVLRTYAASLERLGAELREARAAGDPATVRRVAHTLKSSSASIGALALATLCAQVESAARQPVGGHEQALLDAFDVESQRVVRAVRARLGPA
jgi:histidine phosphotransfer protein HptB